MTTYSAKAIPSETLGMQYGRRALKVTLEMMYALGVALSANGYGMRSGMLSMVDSQEKAVLVVVLSP